MKENICLGCGTCCSHIALEIDKPTSKEDFQDIIWYIMHQNVIVFVDDEGDWYLEFKTSCKALNKQRRCDIYEKRPTICRGYSADECEKNGSGNYYKHIFKTREEVVNYIKKHTRIKNFAQ